MSKEVQLRGHEAVVANQFIGLARELTVDTDNWELRLHDAVKVGGFRILNRDQNDERYQRRSTELDGLLGWEPNEVGFVTRVGSGEYRLRTIQYAEASILVTDGDGHDASPIISLAPTVTSDHVWTGEHRFTQPIEAEGGLVGNTTGFHTGNVLGNVEGNLTGNSTGDHFGDVTGNLTGGFDTRGADIIMDDGQIDPDWIAGFTDALAGAGLPVGSIVMWAGSIGALPLNWKICDGTGGTPDLRDRFVVGAGVAYTVGTTGGDVEHQHALTTDPTGAHTHTGAVGGHVLTVDEIPSHRHKSGAVWGSSNEMSRGSVAAEFPQGRSVDGHANDGTLEAWGSNVGGGQAHTHALTTDEGGAHTHEGGTALANHLPPYYALLYIMKVA